ncbi:MAG: phosphoglycerate dehydrogenase [Planctomycetota bacterium]
MFRVLVCDKLAPEGVDILSKTERLRVDVKTGLSREELSGIIGEYDGIIVRSATKLDAELIGKATRLRAISRAGVGVDNIDVEAASRRGVIVMNTPGGNTTSTAEHTLALMMALSRNVHPAATALKAGKWDPKSFVGTQLAGKTIGVIGLGRVGEQVARSARALGMNVIGYDPYMAETKAPALGIESVQSPEDMYGRCDYLTVHTPLTDETRNLIGREAISRMKDGVRILNCARGGIVDEAALLEGLKSGKVAGAALDVFETEPPANRELVEHPKALCTPHLGASTREAQVLVAVEAAQEMIDALLGREIRFAVNAPMMDWSKMPYAEPLANLAYRIGELLSQLAMERVRKIETTFQGDVPRDAEEVVGGYLLVAVLRKLFGDPVNLVNARLLARESRIDVQAIHSSVPTDFPALISARLSGDGWERTAGGTLFHQHESRIVAIDSFAVEAIPQGDLLVIRDKDRPGLVGETGTILGRHGINIARMTFGRKAVGGDAILVLNLDSVPRANLESAAAALGKAHDVRLVRLAGEPSAWLQSNDKERET